MRPRLARAALLLAALVTVGASSDPPDWQLAEPGYAWEFPRDHWAHPGYRTEWWYFTGHLTTAEPTPRRFGYQFILFRVGLTPQPPRVDSAWAAANLLMGHAAVTDLDRGEHRVSEVLYRESPLLAGFEQPPGPAIAWSLGPVGTAQRWSLDWTGEGFAMRMADAARRIALRLEATPRKPVVFQGPDGFSPKSADGAAASLYYSFTRLATVGTLEIDGLRLPVRGESWLDREFSSSQLTDDQVGWDWFSLRLADGRDLMLYRLRRADGRTDYARGTLVDEAGSATYLAPGEWTLTSTSSWESPRTDAVYPAGWRIEIPARSLQLEVVPQVADQETVAELAGGLHYWEGAVTVRDAGGAEVGRGYVELTGYGKDNRPPL